MQPLQPGKTKSPLHALLFAAGGLATRWIGEGRMRIDEDVVDGIENAYSAFMGLFSGGNRGKLILRIA
jgi:NADPH-dependent curcumin reductase CurA